MAYSQIFFPLSLPQRPQRDSYAETLAKNTIETDMDTGPKRVRKRSSAGMEVRRLVYVLNHAQRETARAFFSENEGRSFWWPDPLITATDGSNYRYARVRSEIKFTPFNGLHWRLEIEIEIWPFVTREA